MSRSLTSFLNIAENVNRGAGVQRIRVTDLRGHAHLRRTVTRHIDVQHQ